MRRSQPDGSRLVSASRPLQPLTTRWERCGDGEATRGTPTTCYPSRCGAPVGVRARVCGKQVVEATVCKSWPKTGWRVFSVESVANRSGCSRPHYDLPGAGVAKKPLMLEALREELAPAPRRAVDTGSFRTEPHGPAPGRDGSSGSSEQGARDHADCLHPAGFRR